MKILRVSGWGLIAFCFLLFGCSKSDIKKIISKSDEKSTQETKAAASTQPAELTAKWPVGNRYTERLQVNQTVDTTMAQAQKPVSQIVKLEQEFALDVVKERELEMEFLSAEMEVTAGGKVVANLDTKSEAGAAEANNPLAESFRQLVGTKLKCLLDASNKVQKIEGLKEFIEKASTASPRNARPMVRSMFNEDYFKQIVERDWLPNKTVKPGDSWPVKMELSAGPLGKIKTDLKYTFKSWEAHDKRNCVLLEFTGTLAPVKTAATNQLAMMPTLDGGTVSGKTWFDPEAGAPIESDIDQTMNMKTTYTMPVPRNRTNAVAQAAPVTQTASVQLKQKINMKLVDFSGSTK